MESSKAAKLKNTLVVFEDAKNLTSRKTESICTTKLARNDNPKHTKVASTKIVATVVFSSHF